ncbi:MAG: class III extradiol dioxygenase subunit B-like domain-containing protein [bacterium]
MIVFACVSPHPPLLLPAVGSLSDKEKVSLTIKSLNILGNELKKANPDKIIISSPHDDWGFNVPLFFVANGKKMETEKYLTGSELPKYYFEEGKIRGFEIENCQEKVALIASGDMSHCLKTDGPYGYHVDGPAFDQGFIKALNEKNIERIITLDNKFPEAGECGLRSFAYLLGILIGSKRNWTPEILSYEWPFGVGYLTVKFNIDQ